MPTTSTSFYKFSREETIPNQVLKIYTKSQCEDSWKPGRRRMLPPLKLPLPPLLVAATGEQHTW